MEWKDLRAHLDFSLNGLVVLLTECYMQKKQVNLVMEGENDELSFYNMSLKGLWEIHIGYLVGTDLIVSDTFWLDLVVFGFQ